MGIIGSILICLFLNMIISFIVQMLVPNYYLAEMIVSVIIAFIYAIFICPDKLHFYKYKEFWMYFLGTAVVFLLFDCLFFLI
ncbi:MAG: hypothetical protein WCR56_02295 [Bacilli bacterium]|jgi:uncharacterized membrane protein